MKYFVQIALIFCATTLLFAPAAQACEEEAECLAEYAAAVLDRDTPIDLDAAGQALRAGCAINTIGQSCRILSFLVQHEVVAGTQSERPDLNLRGCEAGDYVACNYLANGTLNLKTWEAPRDANYMVTRLAIERSCADGNDFACRSLVRYVSVEDAARYIPRCDAGETVFCALLGGAEMYPYYESREGVRRAENTFRALCEGGEGIGCIFLADVISSGNGHDFYETQEAHMIRACDLGIAHGCNVARDIMLAKNPNATRVSRLRFLQPSCDAGFSLACVTEAKLKSVGSDAAMARYADKMKEECLAGNALLCGGAAYVYNDLETHLDLANIYPDLDQHFQNFSDFAKALAGL